ncbi:nuclear GTPase SLIP-GC-like [Mugil cephalus]|uniref:nuclear GTPase SLIP-GC-like n=1 Tax=Mugil cephalus TaxID=48193 RepID=UPI001FB64F04|nr:nuclear GTPase SLIP-GC-like [Mugil cephalus]
MDDFVRNKLTEWGLSKWIDRFKEEEIDEESFCDIEDKDLYKLITKIGPRTKFKKRVKSLKEQQSTTQETNDVSVQCKQEPEEEAELLQVLPSTSVTAKRPLDPNGESSKEESPAKRQRGSYSEENILSQVKKTMGNVHSRLNKPDNTKLNAFLKNKIDDLETDKRELVGVFGRTGAGKSSLINAIIGEKDLLPTGSISSCTTVMIKVEANMQDSKYEADIEFITKEEWKEELRSLDQLPGDNANQESEDDDDDDGDNDDDDDDGYLLNEKLSALYGQEYKNKSSTELMDKKYFKEIPDFLQSSKKTFTCQSAKELSAELVKYTRHESGEGEGKAVERFYWPLVKCVTIKVPHNEFLQHVTLVNLPGNGDCNNSRDKMWKEVVRDCSTVWIVTDITRAAAEKEPWEILKNASTIMGNGGECQHIHFICTKSDQIDDLDDDSDVHAHILKRNEAAKKKVETKFKKLKKTMKQLSNNCPEVFTVSSKEFLKGKYLQTDETEIPKLQKFLRDLNDHHSLNYVSGAYGILCWIQGARHREGADNKTNVCADIKKKMNHQLDNVREKIDEVNKTFEKHLTEGVRASKHSYEEELNPILHLKKDGRGFHKTLKCVVKNGGVYRTKNGKLINLNMTLSSHLTKSIDEEFKKTFPNKRECEPFNGVIGKTVLVTDELIQKYKDVALWDFLKTEEEKMKTKLISRIRNDKKAIYSSLTETIEMYMRECYESAAGKPTLKNMRDTIEKHVQDSKDVIFDRAKDAMLNQLNQLKENIMKTMETTMKKATEVSLKTDDSSCPDVSAELAEVKKIYKELKSHKKRSG